MPRTSSISASPRPSLFALKTPTTRSLDCKGRIVAWIRQGLQREASFAQKAASIALIFFLALLVPTVIGAFFAFSLLKEGACQEREAALAGALKKNPPTLLKNPAFPPPSPRVAPVMSLSRLEEQRPARSFGEAQAFYVLSQENAALTHQVRGLEERVQAIAAEKEVSVSHLRRECEEISQRMDEANAYKGFYESQIESLSESLEKRAKQLDAQKADHEISIQLLQRDAKAAQAKIKDLKDRLLASKRQDTFTLEFLNTVVAAHAACQQQIAELQTELSRLRDPEQMMVKAQLMAEKAKKRAKQQERKSSAQTAGDPEALTPWMGSVS